METTTKINIKKMKENIKIRVEFQKFYKSQKNSNRVFSNVRREAQRKHLENRKILRIMYAAYGLARGKKFSQIENHYSEENHPLKNYQRNIDNILKEYSYFEELPMN